MKVREMIERLGKFPIDMEVICHEKKAPYDWKPKSIFVDEKHEVVVIRDSINKKKRKSEYPS